MLNAIAQAFVVGAARGQTAGDEIIIDSKRYRMPAQNAGERLLCQAGAAALITLALRPPSRPAVRFAPSLIADPRPMLGQRSAYLLQRLCSNEDYDLLHEALLRMGQSGRRVPLALLPALLEALDAPQRRAWIDSVRCTGTAWLAEQNPAWRWVMPVIADPLRSFELEVGKARHAAFAQLRHSDPPAARELLMNRFSAESAEERALLLKTLEQGLSLADEAFLETALDDRAKAVRQAAAALLCSLPQSALAERMRVRTLPLLRIERVLLRRQLRVDLPPEADKAAERDGIDIKASLPGLTSIGPRQLHLAQLIAAVPPPDLARHLDVDIAALVDYCQAHEYAAALCAGLALAAARHRCHDALRALAVLADKPALRGIYAQSVETQLPMLPDFADLVLERLRLTHTPDQALLAALPAPWPEALSAAVMQWLRDPERLRLLSKDYSHYEYVALLKLAALRVTPSAQWLKGWPVYDADSLNTSQARAVEAIDGLASTLQRRIDLIASLEMP